jgi:hypothetical protein
MDRKLNYYAVNIQHSFGYAVRSWIEFYAACGYGGYSQRYPGAEGLSLI